MALPQPVRYEELQREVMSECRPAGWGWACVGCVLRRRALRLPALLGPGGGWVPTGCVLPSSSTHRCAQLTLATAVSLKPDLFEGMRFDITKPLNHNFALSHRCAK